MPKVGDKCDVIPLGPHRLCAPGFREDVLRDLGKGELTSTAKGETKSGNVQVVRCQLSSVAPPQELTRVDPSDKGATGPSERSRLSS